MLVAACLLPEASAQLNGYRRVHSWGSNRFGELGIDHVEGQASQAKENQCDPQFVPTLGHEALGPEGANLQRIVSGQNHVVAVTQEGDMYVWGRNDMGQLGLGFQGAEDTRTRYKPTLLELFSANGVKLEVIDVALGLEHTVVLVSGGRVYAWGSNQHGQLGIDVTPDLTPFTSVPTAIDVGGESVMNVSAAAYMVLLVRAEAVVVVVHRWGVHLGGEPGGSARARRVRVCGRSRRRSVSQLREKADEDHQNRGRELYASDEARGRGRTRRGGDG